MEERKEKKIWDFVSGLCTFFLFIQFSYKMEESGRENNGFYGLWYLFFVTLEIIKF